MDIDSGATATLNEAGGHVGEVHKFTSTGGTKGNTYSSKYVEITGAGAMVLHVSPEQSEQNGDYYTLTDTTLDDTLNGEGRYIGLADTSMYTLKTNGSTSITVQ